MRILIVGTLALVVSAFACGGDDPSSVRGGGSSSGTGSSSGSSGASSGGADGGGSSGSSGSSGTTSGGSGDPTLDDARAYNLAQINKLRAQNGRAALVLDDALNGFAQAASTELSTDHKPHQYFSDHASSCKCGIMSENQGDWNGWTPGPIHQQIDDILALMMSGGPGEGHHDNILSPQVTRLGVGVVNPGAKMFFTNDFGP
jgi:hypothetical protein